MKLRHLFCISVVSWTVIYCVLLWTNLFSVNLKPKGVFFFVFFLAFVLHWLKISVVCCLLFQFIAGILFIVSARHLAECPSSVFVTATQTRMVLTGSKWVNSCLFDCFLFFLFLLLSCFLFSQRGVECAIPHTAIYAGQELWHFIFCLWDL